MEKYLMNISKGIIHNGKNPCAPAKRISESNKKWFANLSDAINFYEGNIKKGCPCSICFKEENNF